MLGSREPDAPAVTDAPKRCPYCLHEHSNRGRACSEWCERKIRSHRGSVTAGRNRAVKKVMAGIIKREQHKGKWRNVAMGRNAAENLRMIFGIDVPSEPPPYIGMSGSDEP